MVSKGWKISQFILKSYIYKSLMTSWGRFFSGGFSVRQEQRKVVENKKSGFFLLSLKYTLRTCFDTINFLPKSCPELRYSVFQPVKFTILVLSSCVAISFQLFDIRWSNLDKIDDFNPISRTVFFRFGEINKSLFWVLSQIFF